MKKVIGGLIYNTETAEHLADVRCPYSHSDFNWEDTGIYKTPRGRFFLAGEGHAASRWAKSYGHSERGPGSGIEPIDEDRARSMLERLLNVSEYEKVFGKVEEA
jgi:hypothetical protein